MHHYVAFGLSVHSEVPLPGFVSGSGKDLPHVSIKREHIPADRWPAWNDDGLRLAGVARGVMHFRVIDGETIIVDPLPDGDQDYMKAIISGELFAALLRQRGLLVLHGSSVAHNGRAVGFVGYSGWGKSTLASAFVERGWRLLGDDLLVLDLNDPSTPMATPGYPQLKLAPDVGPRFFNEYDELPGAHSQTTKRLVARPEDFQREAVPLTDLYLLEGRHRDTDSALPMSGREAFVEMLRHTRATNLIKAPGMMQALTHQVAAVQSAVEPRLLHRRRSLDNLPDLVGLILSDITKASAHVPMTDAEGSLGRTSGSLSSP